MKEKIQTIPESVLAQIEKKYPERAIMIKNLRRAPSRGMAIQIERILADYILLGEAKLPLPILLALGPCCVGREYGERYPNPNA